MRRNMKLHARPTSVMRTINDMFYI